MEEKHRRFAAAFILQIANLGSIEIMWEIVAQNIASYIATDGDPAMLASSFGDIASRVGALLNEGGIWDELMPGPVRDEPTWDKLMAVMNHLLENNEGDDLAISLRSGQAVRWHGESVGIIRPAENIVLDYPVILRRGEGDGQTSMYAPGAEFFVDEHGRFWVKFKPKNGYNIGKEHMWPISGDRTFEVVRDDA